MKTVIAFLIFRGLQLAAQDMQTCPMHKEHMEAASQHQADMENASLRDTGKGSRCERKAHARRKSPVIFTCGVSVSQDLRRTKAVLGSLARINGLMGSPEFLH